MNDQDRKERRGPTFRVSTAYQPVTEAELRGVIERFAGMPSTDETRDAVTSAVRELLASKCTVDIDVQS